MPSPAELFGSLLFGVIGMAAVMYGKKSAEWKPMLIGAIVVFAIGNALAGLADSLTVLFLVRILLGLAAGVFTPTANAVAVAMVPPAMRGRAIATVIGGFLGALAAGRSVRPLADAARAARAFADGRLDTRLEPTDDQDLHALATAFNEMAASLERQIHQLEELSRVQRRFVSDVSHELRTPLTTVRMAAEVIHEARSALEPTLSRSSELLVTQLDRFESLLSDLLEVSRFDAGAANLDLEPVDLRTPLRKVVDAARPLPDRRGTHLTLDLPNTPGEAEVDERRVERILRNLVVNAIEHSEGHPVVATARSDGDAVAVVVSPVLGDGSVRVRLVQLLEVGLAVTVGVVR